MYGRSQEEINAMMERYLGARFKKGIPVGDSTGLDLRFGLMPTEWLDGSIFVRQEYRKPEEPEERRTCFQEWENAPFCVVMAGSGPRREYVRSHEWPPRPVR